ncbi:hypothetical protein JCM19236_6296 [Vibrio sp. JCM 19236]|nr:hypothetical protein JCM19236_6296 [Vibrio sp. JCM 19236]
MLITSIVSPVLNFLSGQGELAKPGTYSCRYGWTVDVGKTPRCR